GIRVPVTRFQSRGELGSGRRHQVLSFLLGGEVAVVRRQVSQMQQRTGVDSRHVLHAVLELANVAGPVVGKQDFHRLSRYVVVSADSRQEMVDQRGNILLALAQRSQAYIDDDR